MVLRRKPAGRRHVARLAVVSLTSLSLVGLAGTANADLLGGHVSSKHPSGNRDLCLPGTPLIDLPSTCPQKKKEPSAAPSSHAPSDDDAAPSHALPKAEPADAQPAVKPHLKPKAKPHLKPKAKPHLKPKSEPKAKTDARSAARSEAQPQADPGDLACVDPSQASLHQVQADEPSGPCLPCPPTGGLGDVVGGVIGGLADLPCDGSDPTPPPTTPPPTTPPPTTPPPTGEPTPTPTPTTPAPPNESTPPSSSPTSPGINGEIPQGVPNGNPDQAGPAQPIGGSPDFTG